ncbi:hypothetical protein BJ138DRAFT_1182144 [Hygrophoropsis aurantiaca]|uniref:Uncharacterized protein n=1 Tax=Hygrophoropsis aurantiaca TaxID=72124 RepID=A0ACB8A486_9AGAM|nr:hypothetical protein BJ138DRAFT_1182144 [Hygrophoropsis aurantiaca]
MSFVFKFQVSEHLRQVTYDRSIWAHVYRTSSLVHPDGPLECQTAQMLESILARSTRLQPNWPPNPKIKPVRTRILPIQDERAEVSLLRERWLLVTNGDKQIVCYDLDATTTRTATGPAELPYAHLYDSLEENVSIVSFECDLILPSCTKDRCGAGRSHPQPLAFLAVVLHMDRPPNHMHVRTMLAHLCIVHRREIYKINVAGDDFPTLCLLHKFDMDFDPFTQVVLSPRLLAIYNPVRLPKQAILIDVETRQLYESPATTNCPQVSLRLSHAATQIGALSLKDELSNLSDHHIPRISSLRDLTVDHATGIRSMALTCTLACAYICVLHLRLHPAFSPLPRGTAAAASNRIGTITLEPGNNVDIGGDVNLDLPDQYPPIVQPAFNGHTRGIGFYFL